MNNQSKSAIFVELFEEYENVNFYTLRHSESKLSETEQFFREFADNNTFKFEIDVLINVLHKFTEEGVLQRRLRPEGQNIYAIPITISKLRLYLYYLNSSLIILGNGGIKKSRTYQEDPLLNKIVMDLKMISMELKNRMVKKEVQIIDNQRLTGNLKFEISDNNEKE